MSLLDDILKKKTDALGGEEGGISTAPLLDQVIGTPKPQPTSPQSVPTAQVGESATGVNLSQPAYPVVREDVDDMRAWGDNRQLMIVRQSSLKVAAEITQPPKLRAVLATAEVLVDWVMGKRKSIDVIEIEPPTAVSAPVMCPIHKDMPLDKKTKEGTPAHTFVDVEGAIHKCIPKLLGTLV